MNVEKVKCEGMMFFFPATHRAEDDDRAELNQAVQRHVSEKTEGGDQRTSALSEWISRKNY